MIFGLLNSISKRWGKMAAVSYAQVWTSGQDYNGQISRRPGASASTARRSPGDLPAQDGGGCGLSEARYHVATE
jgi:hypothetical protein